MSKKIAFIKIGDFSHINRSVERLLKDCFPGFEVETIDIFDKFLKRKPNVYFMNTLYVIKEFGLKNSIGRDLAIRFFHTTYIFRLIKSYISKYLSEGNYIFSFQTQSLFDASSKYIPHFVYTDNTVLANLYYLSPEEIYSEYSDSWIRLERTIYHNSSINFTMSSNVSKSMIEQYSCSQHKVACVYAGSNVKNIGIDLNKKRYDNKHILFVGREWERKGGKDLIEAFKIVLSSHPDAKLTIVGCTPNISIKNCNVIGRITLQELHRYYLDASVFCLPTKREPFGIAFVEALMHGLPIVATNIAAIPDFVLQGQNGYLVKPNDIRGLASALIELISDPDKCRVFGKNGFHIAMERYTWENVASLIKSHIESVI